MPRVESRIIPGEEQSAFHSHVLSLGSMDRKRLRLRDTSRSTRRRQQAGPCDPGALSQTSADEQGAPPGGCACSFG